MLKLQSRSSPIARAVRLPPGPRSLLDEAKHTFPLLVGNVQIPSCVLRAVEPYHLKETAIVVDVDLLLELGPPVVIDHATRLSGLSNDTKLSGKRSESAGARG